ncbi:Katanin p80 WD40 repeat-containing subunit B1-like isoform X2 [Oopsacas minuta]|uniref:Katanin p80 WD40 repeat-containing subunit B1 n=1 Tax=Oopsacas minuta TaxID=111878 RepID=A0AAV7K1X6_9METZ|nr:Katanin p80 WD40 repeat-containing subunit B1-like isoform X2 [Oopsacas minuta]
MSTPTASKKITKLHEFVASTSEVRCLALGPKQSRVMVTGGTDNKISVWIIGRPNLLMSFGGHTASVECVRFRADEQVVASGSASGTLKVYDLDQGSCIRTLSGHKAGISSLDFHTSEMLLASGSLDTRVRVWDVRKKGCIFSYQGHTGKVNSLLFSPDGKWLSSAGDDGYIKIWELSSGKLLQDFSSHAGPITSLEYHPNELLLASGSQDRTAKFWDLEQFRMVDESQPEATGIRKLTFHPNGDCLFTGSQECLRIHSWEPWCCYETVPAGWGKLADMRIVSDQLIAASYSHSSVSVWTSDVTTMRPFRKDDESVNCMEECDKLSASHRGIFEKYDVNKSPTDDIAREHSQSDSSDHEDISSNNNPQAMDFGPTPDEFKVVRVHNLNKNISKEILKQPKIQQPTPQDDFNRPRILKVASEEAFPQARRIQTENDSNERLRKVLEDGNISVLRHRLQTHRDIARHWDPQNPIISLRRAINTGEQEILIHLLALYNQRLSLWTLNTCLVVLPELRYLMQSHKLFFVQTTANTLRLILKTFGPVIAINVNQPPPTGAGVDISREERYEKCYDSFAHLNSIRDSISNAKFDMNTAEITQIFDEVKQAFTVLDQPDLFYGTPPINKL